jgi:hypothetical protein
MLQTMLVTSITQSTVDLKEDIADNCNDVLEKFYNEFFLIHLRMVLIK